LNIHGNLKSNSNIFIAGQISGVEGYVESTASGLVCAMQIERMLNDKEYLNIPEETMIGALMKYITTDKGNRKLEPMNANFGLLPQIEERIRDKKIKKQILANRSLKFLEDFKRELING